MRKLSLQIDWVLLASLVGIVTMGMAIVASTTQARFGSYRPFLLRQGAAIIVGLVVAWWLSRLDYHVIPTVSRWLYVANLALLALVLVLGHTQLGAQRWIAIGPLSLQPSETAKLFTILTLAVTLSQQERLDRWQDLLPSLLHIAPAAGLILIQPDLGTTLVFLVTLAAMLYAAGFPGWKLTLLFTLAMTVMVGWIVVHLRYHVWLPLKPYQLNRLIVFASPQVDPSGLGYQIGEAKVAIGTGGLLGQGLFHGVITRLNYLPEQFTDFIFAALTEELGFVGAGALLSLFALMLWRILAVAGAARDKLGSLLAVGVAGMLSFHIVENIGMNLGLMPVAGIPLPFVSYGGTAMAVDLVAIGLVLSVWRHRRKIQF